LSPDLVRPACLPASFMVELSRTARLTILPGPIHDPASPRLLPPAAPDTELDLLLLDRPESGRTRRIRYAVGGSLLFHAVLFLLGTRISSIISSEDAESHVSVNKTPLYFPPELTQKAPNQNKLTERFNLQDLLAAQAARQQQAAAAAHRKFVPKAGELVVPVKNLQPQISAEAPTILAQNTTTPIPGAPNGILPSTVPPPPRSTNPFEDIGQQPVTKPTMTPPRATVQDAIRGLSHEPNGVGMVISDESLGQAVPPTPGVKPSPVRMGSQVELKSDPLGADLKPYLIEVLKIVKRNWLNVIPESVRLGTRRGRTIVEFAVDRDGTVAKVVISDYSGSDPLDRAAVAGLSMSNPLPPLPKEYRGLQVRLAMSFNYNVTNVR
jgi:TonB family protein